MTNPSITQCQEYFQGVKIAIRNGIQSLADLDKPNSKWKHCSELLPNDALRIRSLDNDMRMEEDCKEFISDILRNIRDGFVSLSVRTLDIKKWRECYEKQPVVLRTTMNLSEFSSERDKIDDYLRVFMLNKAIEEKNKW